MSKRRLYAAYGSNLNLPQMAARCPTAKPVGVAVLEGYELLFRGGRYGAVATVEPKADAAVPVLIWKLRPKDEAMLDRYEGFPHLYTKREAEVELNGKPLRVMAYVMTPGPMAGIPSQGYLAVIAEGYKTAGFDLAILDAAVERSAVWMEQEYAELEQLQTQARDAALFGLKWR